MANKIFLLSKGMAFGGATSSVAHEWRIVRLSFVLTTCLMSSQVHVCRGPDDEGCLLQAPWLRKDFETYGTLQIFFRGS